MICCKTFPKISFEGISPSYILFLYSKIFNKEKESSDFPQRKYFILVSEASFGGSASETKATEALPLQTSKNENSDRNVDTHAHSGS